MELQVGVKILIKNPSGKYLILKRSPVKYPNNSGMWDIPGGRIQPGTPLVENLNREVLEETGMKIDGNLSLVSAQDILRVHGKHIVRITYKGTSSDTPAIVGDEHVEYRWISMDEMKKMNDLDIYLKEIVSNIKEG